jgi:hypothetical protein
MRVETDSICVDDLQYEDYKDSFDVAPKYLPVKSSIKTQFILQSKQNISGRSIDAKVK